MVRRNFEPSLPEIVLGWGILIFVCFMTMFIGWKLGIILDKYNKGVYNDVLPKTLIKKVIDNEGI